MRLSIRYKILAVLGILLFAAVCFYTLLASSIFYEEKTALLYDLNHSLAVNTASQLNSSLRQVGDEIKLYAVSRILAEKSDLRLPAKYLQDAHVLASELYRKENGGFIPVKLPAEVPSTQVDFARIVGYLVEADAERYAFWNQTSEEQTPRFFVATRLDVEVGGKTQTFVALAEIETKTFFETLQAGNIFQSYLVKATGEVLVHCDHNQVVPSGNLVNHPLLDKIKDRNLASSGVLSFDYAKERWYGAYAPVGIGGLYLFSQASRHEVTAALATLVQRSLLFALIVVTITFIASILFSKSLTRNIQTLTIGARQIGAGDLTSRIAISSGDEVETLAMSFNTMVDQLRASREAIEKYNRELEEKVALRTQQLQETNAAIKEVQEKLLHTTQLAAAGEIAGRTAHELLNPLTAILSRLERSRLLMVPAGASTAESPSAAAQFTEILAAWETDLRKGGINALTAAFREKSTVSPDQTLIEEDLDNLKKLAGFWQQQTSVVAADLDFVQDQAQRIHRIIDRMRELVRSSVKSDVNCHDAVKEALQTMADYMAKHGVRVEEDLLANQDLAVLNRDELVQIITNLLRNSFQALSVRGTEGKILVKSGNSGPLLTIDIIDNGRGIAEEKKRYLFEQGFTTKTPTEGTGLGLAICRRYAHAFGGEVELLYSEPEARGTCFRITIPLKQPSVA